MTNDITLGAAQMLLLDRTQVLLSGTQGGMTTAAVARCGKPVALHFTPEGTDLSQHGRGVGSFLESPSFTVACDCGLLPARDECHPFTCFWLTWGHLNQCLWALMPE